MKRPLRRELWRAECRAPRREQKPGHLSRTEAYVGVMIDDLTMRGITEAPIVCSHPGAEFRLSLRADDADERLTPLR